MPWRTALNYWVDAALTVTFLAMAGLTVLSHLVFPAGQEAYRFHLWGHSIDDWRRYQFASICCLGFLVVVHVTLHWNWVCSVTNTLIRRRPAGKDDGARTLIGVGMLLAILHVLGGLLLWARFSLAAG